jgi:hypothetical protein
VATVLDAAFAPSAGFTAAEAGMRAATAIPESEDARSLFGEGSLDGYHERPASARDPPLARMTD